jgi:hypothetical protein
MALFKDKKLGKEAAFFAIILVTTAVILGVFNAFMVLYTLKQLDKAVTGFAALSVYVVSTMFCMAVAFMSIWYYAVYNHITRQGENEAFAKLKEALEETEDTECPEKIQET